MDTKLLNINDFIKAGQLLKCNVSAIRAVHEVESSGDGFLPSGRIKIRFESHWFSHYTNGEYDKTFPNLSTKEANIKLSLGGELEYDRFNQAFRLNPLAAMMSTSWGAFQIMGFNFGACNFDNVGDMVDSFKKGEREQLLGFCEFIITKKLDDELRERNWERFAYYYNGKSFKKNNYDVKLKKSYEKFLALNLTEHK